MAATLENRNRHDPGAGEEMRNAERTHYPGVLLRSLIAFAVWCFATIAAAHDFIIVRAAVLVDGTTVSVTLLIDQSDLRFALGDQQVVFADFADLEAARGRIGDYLSQGVHTTAEGVPIALAYVGAIEALSRPPGTGTAPPAKLNFLLRGTVPHDAQGVTLAIDLLREHHTPVLTTIRIARGERSSERTVSGGESLSLDWHEPRPQSPTRHWLPLGFSQVIPHGVDHLLFLLCLFLLSPRVRPVLIHIGLFTIAYVLALDWSLLHSWFVPIDLSRTIVAASVVFIALENILVREIKPWRSPMMLAFGIAYGLDAAAALSPRVGDIAIKPLFLLDLGSESAQFIILATAGIVTGWSWGKPWYRLRIAIPANIVIVVIAILFFSPAHD